MEIKLKANTVITLKDSARFKYGEGDIIFLGQKADGDVIVQQGGRKRLVSPNSVVIAVKATRPATKGTGKYHSCPAKPKSHLAAPCLAKTVTETAEAVAA